MLPSGALLLVASAATVHAESAGTHVVAHSQANAHDQIGFSSPRSVGGTLAAAAEGHGNSPLAGFRDWKRQLEARTGLALGFDNIAHYLDTDADASPSDAASNITRLYGTWTPTGQNGPDEGALVFKIEYRTAIGDHISTQALGPSLGYAGIFATGYSDSGLILTNLYWRQHFAGGRGSFVIGQVDNTDYVDVNALADPWTTFANVAFAQQATYAGPSQGLGAALRWRIDDNWAVLGGFADANADPSDPWGSAQTLFDTGETFKHVAVGWTPDWGDVLDRLVQLTLWQIDDREEADVDGGHGIALAVSGRHDKWRSFLRAGYAKDAGVPLGRAISIGVGYDSRGEKDLAGLGVAWGRAPDNSRDQYTVEAFYRYAVTDFLQLTPTIQYVANPANDSESDHILVVGARLRAFF